VEGYFQARIYPSPMLRMVPLPKQGLGRKGG
jgi:hypothetical protein